MNIDGFAPISPDNPCGENLEYDADFQAMGQASQGKAEQQFGDTIIPAEPADWNTVEKLATSLLGRTKRSSRHAGVNPCLDASSRAAGYADGLVLVQEALSRYWSNFTLCWRVWRNRSVLPHINALAGLSDKSDRRLRRNA